MNLTQEIYDNLTEYIDTHPGNSKLQFQIKDSEHQFSLELISKNTNITIEQELIDYIKSLDNIEYKLN